MKLTLLLSLLFIAISSATLVAQDPQLELKPVAEYVPAMMEGDDLPAAQHVFRRCGGLFIIIALQMRELAEAGNDDSLAGAVRYLRWVEGFTLAASTLDPLFEQRQDEVIEGTRGAISDLAEILKKRMDQNLLMSGELWAQDTLIRSDMEVCAAIAGSLFEQGQAPHE